MYHVYIIIRNYIYMETANSYIVHCVWCFYCYRELQHTVSSLQKNIQMLKSEVSRYKTRAHKAEERLNKLMVRVILLLALHSSNSNMIVLHHIFQSNHVHILWSSS